MKYGQSSALRLYYSTPQVCETLGINLAFLLQLEKEFHEITVNKNRAGKKIFRHKDFLYLKLAAHFLQKGTSHEEIHSLLSQAPERHLDDWIGLQLQEVNQPCDNKSPISAGAGAVASIELHNGNSDQLSHIRSEVQKILSILTGI